MNLIKESETIKKNIIGSEVLGKSKNINMVTEVAHKTNTEFWDTIGSEFLGATALPNWGAFYPQRIN